MIIRSLEFHLPAASKYFKSMLVTGPRQVGKTTLLKHIAEPERHYVSLDNKENRNLAISDEELFYANNPFPLLIDEVQRAPNLFLKLKEEIDNTPDSKNLVWITGSQKIRLMNNVSDTLAGRILLVDMYGLTQAEKHNDPQRPVFLPAFEGPVESEIRINNVLDEIIEGSFPESFQFPAKERSLWFTSYIQTYMERDLPDILDVKDRDAFTRFLHITALRTGQELNYVSIANEVKVSDKTIRSWITALESYGLIYILKPYHSNAEKRLVKTPKLYFMDTGLCCHLCGIRNRDELMKSRLAGAIVETYAVSEIIKSYANNLEELNICFYRDSEQHEIDLIIENGGKLHPIEIKMNATPTADMAKNFRFIPDEIRGMGAIVCLSNRKYLIRKDTIVMPIQML